MMNKKFYMIVVLMLALVMTVGAAVAETVPALEPTEVPAPAPAAAFDLTELVVAVICFVLGLMTTLVTGVVQKHFNKNKLMGQYEGLWEIIGAKLEQAGITVDRAAIEAAVKQMGAAALKELSKAFADGGEDA